MLPRVRCANVALCCLAFALVWTATARADDSSAVGRKLENFTLVDVHGKSRSLADLADKELVVVAFLGTECPLAKLYAPRLKHLADEYAARGVGFIAIDANDQDSLTEMASFAHQHEWPFGFWKDREQKLADRLSVARNPAAFVLDRERVVRYAGRIDDQYGLRSFAGYSRRDINRRDLAMALDELLAGKEVSQPSTTATGCLIGRRPKVTPTGDVTFYEHIAPLLDQHCVSCHRPEEIGPFALTDYDEVVGWADMIREVVSEGRMPPWAANPEFGHFANDARLAADEKALIGQWIDNGCPAGDPKDRPTPRKRTEGWGIGEPDEVLRMPKPFKVPAEGVVDYQYILVNTGWKEDKWIQATETRPGNRAVVHHINVGIVPPLLKWRAGSATTPSALSSYVPGSQPVVFPAGSAAYVPVNSKLVFQIHYTPNGVAQTDRSYVGVIFADPKTVKKRVALGVAENRKFKIPPHAVDHELTSTFEFKNDCLLYSMMPHMHLRGQSFRFEANYPDGTTEILLDVPKYDFNWQLRYDLADPKLMPNGTKLICYGRFDNSRDNPFNPDPDQTVRFGDQTWDEMNNGFFVASPVEDDTLPESEGEKQTAPAEDSTEVGQAVGDVALVDASGRPSLD